LKLLLLSIIISNYLWSFACPNIRLDKNFPNNTPRNKAKYKTMNSIGVKNQKLGICYAYTATQMIDAIRSKRLYERGITPNNSNLIESSPIFTAVTTESAWGDEELTYKKNGDPRYPFEGGDLCEAFNSTKELKACPRNQMERLIHNSGLNEESFFKRLLEIEEEMRDKRAQVFLKYSTQPAPFATSTNVVNFFENSSNATTELKACKNNAIHETYDSLKDIFKSNFTITREMFAKYFDPELFSDPFQIKSILKNVCDARITVNTKSTCKSMTGRDANRIKDTKYPFTRKILEELASDSVPVGISYCGYMLYGDKNFDGIKSRSPLRFQKSQGRECGAHSSLIIGSRWNTKTNSCDLLVRNTWGTGCSKQHYPSKSTLQKKNPGKSISQYDVKCEGGNYWIDYRTLEKNIYRVQHL